MQGPETNTGQHQPTVKFCPQCSTEVPASKRVCPNCNYTFSLPPTVPTPPNTKAWGYKPVFQSPPPDTQPGYSPPVQASAPTDYELPRPTPSPYAHDYQAPKYTSQYVSQPKTPLQQYKEYVKFRIHYTSKKASRLRLMHNILQITILSGAALVTITIGFSHNIPSWVPALISGVVTIATAIANYYKFGERSRDLYRSAEDMQQEYNWFKSKRGPYKDLDETKAFELLQDKIDLLRREQFQRSFAFEEQQETQK